LLLLHRKTSGLREKNSERRIGTEGKGKRRTSLKKDRQRYVDCHEKRQDKVCEKKVGPSRSASACNREEKGLTVQKNQVPKGGADKPRAPDHGEEEKSPRGGKASGASGIDIKGQKYNDLN